MNLDGRDRVMEALEHQRLQWSRIDPLFDHAIGALIDHDLACLGFVT